MVTDRQTERLKGAAENNSEETAATQCMVVM